MTSHYYVQYLYDFTLLFRICIQIYDVKLLCRIFIQIYDVTLCRIFIHIHDVILLYRIFIPIYDVILLYKIYIYIYTYMTSHYYIELSRTFFLKVLKKKVLKVTKTIYDVTVLCRIFLQA
jgi:hypothetical protein